MTPPATMGDIPRIGDSDPDIKLYGPPDCPNCETAMALFRRQGVPHEKITLEPGDDNHHYVKDVLGYMTAPVVIVTFDNGRIVHWGGHRMDMLMAVVRHHNSIAENAAQKQAAVDAELPENDIDTDIADRPSA